MGTESNQIIHVGHYHIKYENKLFLVNNRRLSNTTIYLCKSHDPITWFVRGEVMDEAL